MSSQYFVELYKVTSQATQDIIKETWKTLERITKKDVENNSGLKFLKEHPLNLQLASDDSVSLIIDYYLPPAVKVAFLFTNSPDEIRVLRQGILFVNKDGWNEPETVGFLGHTTNVFDQRGLELSFSVQMAKKIKVLRAEVLHNLEVIEVLLGL